MSRVSLLDERLARQIFRRRIDLAAGAPAGPSLLFDYEPGDVISGETFTRSSVARQKNSSGNWESIAVDTKRDGHYIGGVRHLLLEPQRTNLALYSNDLTGAAWSGGATTAQNATGIDGVANHATTLTDSNAAGYGVRSQAWNIAADNSSYICSVYIAKDNDESRFPGFAFSVDAISRVFPTINTKTGALGSWLAPVGTGTASVTDDGNFWRLDMRVSNNSTQTSMALDIYPAIATAINGPDSGTVTGSCVIGQVQVEAATTPSAPIFTTSAAVTRARDALFGNFPIAYEEMTGLIDYVDLSFDGTSVQGIGNSGTPKAFIADGSQPYVQMGAALAQLGAAGARLDRFELMPYFTSDFKVQLTRSINGGASTSTALSSAAASFTDWSAGRIDFGADPGSGGPAMIAIRKIKYIAGAKTLTEMRAL